MASSTVYQYTSVYVRISEAKKLPSRDMMSSTRDPFCVLKVDNETVARTATTYKTLEPFWGEEYNLHIPYEFQNVIVYVYDTDIMGSKDPLGKVMVDRETVMKSPRGVDKWIPLTPILRDDEVQGEILVEMNLEQYSEDAYKLLLTVVEARDLAAKGDHKLDPFATVYYNGEQHSTSVMQKTRFPRWKKGFDITVPGSLTDPMLASLKIVVYDWEKLSQNKFMGQVEMDLAELQVGQRYKTWYRLQHHDQEPKHKEKSKELGSLRVKVQLHEERILDTTLYEPFIRMMLKAVEDPQPEGSPILVMLEEVMTMDRNALGHYLVRFYLAHGSVIPLLDTLTMREIHQTTTPRTLFRGNSLASKSFDQFMKIVALSYLHETLSPAIDHIYADHKLCELDVDALKQASKVKSDHIHMKTVETSVAILTHYLEMIMKAIFNSVTKCPSFLRLALRQLWLRVAEKYKDAEHADVPFLAITGFLFLRFFVPAILSPKLFAVKDEHPDQKTERTLKLIAKVLQNIGNLSPEMDAKEKYMMHMSCMLPGGVKRVKDFILELVQIDQSDVAAEKRLKDGGYIHHLILCQGWLWKRSSSAVTSHLQYRKKFFEISNIAFTYSHNEKKLESKSYPVQWIKLVEKLDEGAFHRKHMFQVIIIPSGAVLPPDTPSQVTLYLQAADVNEQNRWVSAIRKACLTNRDMSPVYHPGAFKKNKWSCCRTAASMEPGCSQCHRGITIGDWRDPLDPELDAQVLYSQFCQGRSALVKTYLGGDDTSISTREDSMSPTSLSSMGATSLQHEGEHGDSAGGTRGSTSGSAATGQSVYESGCRQLLSVVDELAWYHSQIQVT